MWFVEAEIDQPWFLATRKSLIVTQIAFGMAALAISLGRASNWRERFRGGGALAAGALVALAGTFWIVGPEKLMLGSTHLWPLALLAATVLLVLPVLAGTLLGGFFRGCS